MSILVRRPRTIKGIVSILDNYACQQNLIFRGHKWESYRLETTLYRTFKYIHYASWNTFIDERLYSFRARLAQLGELPFKSNDIRDWMEYARHQGLPAPYIDFTLSPYVALFFAISGINPNISFRKDEKYSVIYVVNTHSLFQAWIRAVGVSDPSAFNLFQLEYDGFFKKSVLGDSLFPIDTLKLFYIPSVYNTRMLNQRSVLLYDTVNYELRGYIDLENLLDAEEDIDGIPNLTKVFIPKILANSIYEELERKGISGFSLFQSPEGIIQDLVNEYYYNRTIPSPRFPFEQEDRRMTMGLDKYRISEDSSFMKYYDEFLQNYTRARKYIIKLKDGTIIEGVPTAGSFVDMRDPYFMLTIRNDKYRIPFRDLLQADLCKDDRMNN